MEIVDGIHRIETETGGKHLFLYVLELADGLLLIDTGESHHPEEAIFPFLEAHNWAPTDLRWVFITHADVDHFGGNHIIRAAAPQATFACHNQDRGWVGSRERTLAEHYNRYKTRYGVSYPDEVQDWLRSAMGPDVPVELGFVGGENIEIKDGRELVVLHTPGHTPGHLSFWDATTRTAIIGDAVLGDAVREANGRPQSPPPYYTPQSYLSSIQTLQALQPARLLTCHYPCMEGEAVAEFLDQSRAWAMTCDQTVRDCLQSGGAPVTLARLIDQVDERLGPYPFKLAFKYTLTGHAENLVSARQASVTKKGNILAWEWNR
ncbi:MAG: MBL fold metallo-hydrolase [Anaerolineales bacterium]|nr:MBL fold metallo-hydrolase [Arenicellales bacterium]MDP7644818.1 MBL fold metallo-hydrolase [Anaerolineales bacterium]